MNRVEENKQSAGEAPDMPVGLERLLRAQPMNQFVRLEFVPLDSRPQGVALGQPLVCQDEQVWSQEDFSRAARAATGGGTTEVRFVRSREAAQSVSAAELV